MELFVTPPIMLLIAGLMESIQEHFNRAKFKHVPDK